MARLSSLNSASLNPQKGLVLDYNLVSTQTNFTAQSDTTYFVTNSVYLYGTTTIEGGTVVKFSTNSSAFIENEGTVNCLTASYRPAVFTAQDDNTVGSSLPWSSGTPSGYYGNPALGFENTTNIIHNLIVKYANMAFVIDGMSGAADTLNDAQIVFCNEGVNYNYFNPPVNNVLMYNVVTPFTGDNGGIFAVNATVDGCNTLLNTSFGGITVTNCVLANITNWLGGSFTSISGDYNGLYNTPSLTQTHPYTNTTSPFQTVGAAAHYLASGCNFTNVGSSNIASSVIADLAQKTTQPPFVIGSSSAGTEISTNVTLSPLVLRDTQARPDLGYHFDCLDYALGNVYLSNANLTITPGTAIGTFSSIGEYGCSVLYGSHFVSQGSPTNLNHIAYYNTVQEQANTNWTGSILASVYGNYLSGASTYVFCRFTDWSVLAQDVTHFDANSGGTLGNVFQDCQFHGGLLNGTTVGITLTNCLLERVNFTGQRAANLQNNLFWRGSFSSYSRGYGGGVVADNMFDQTVIATSGSYTETNNAYNTNTLTNPSYTNVTFLSVTNVGDVYLTNSSYQPGPLGNYYLPTTSPLINAGSNYASQVGLYHYTTTTNQVPEASSLIDLGYHYIALNPWGMPLDTDGDGVPDYLADTNGNGVYDPGIDPQNWESPMVVAWGDNSSGQCNVPFGLSNVVAVAGGLGFSLALQSGGTVVAWGDNTYLQLNITNAIGVTNIAANYYDSMALSNSEVAAIWGDYWLPPSETNATVPANSNNVAVAVGASHGLGLKNNGTVVAWAHAFSVPTNLTPVKAIAAAWDNDIALETNGTVVAWGSDVWGLTNVPADLTNATSISAFAEHGLALQNGIVEAWGNNDFGQTDVPTGLSNVMAIAAGEEQSVALQSNGNVVVWGQFNGGPTYVPQGLTGVTAIEAGDYHCLAVRSGVLTPVILQEPVDLAATNGGTVTNIVQGQGLAAVAYQWQFNGVNLAGQTSSSLTLTGVGTSQVGTYDVVVSNGAGSITSSNASFNLIVPPVITALTQPGQQWIYYGTNGALSVTVQPPPAGAPALSYQWSFDGTNISGATASSYTIPVAGGFTAYNEGTYSVEVTNNVNGSTNISWQVLGVPRGGVAGWGKDDFGQIERPFALTNVIGITAGESNSVAVQENGQVVQWGYTWASVPSNLTNAVAVSAGYSHSLALNSNGTVTAWGAAGDPANTVPSGLTNVTAIACGWYHNLALTNGAVVAWGTNNATITNVPATLTNAGTVIAIAAGSHHSLALLTNGTVVAWGYTNSGQCNVPTNLTNVVAIAAGKLHSLALQSNGFVFAWGDNTYGQTNVPAGLSNFMAIAAGDGFSMALLNNGTVTNWGDDAYGEITNEPPTLANVKLIAAGGGHALAAIFSNTLLYYPLDVSKDLLLVYNTNSIDSSNICAYYLQHRPMVGNANVLGIGSPYIYVDATNGYSRGHNIAVGDTNVFETVSPSDFTNYVLTSVANWLSINPTKHPQYVLMFHDVPTRVDALAAVSNAGTNFPFYTGPINPYAGVTYQLMTEIAGWHPLISYLDMGNPNACIAYINKLSAMGSNNPSGSLIISASANSYFNTNYYIDDSGEGPSLALESITNALVIAGVPQAAISYIASTNDSGSDNYTNATDPAVHLVSGTNVCGYACWGFHSSLGGDYATDAAVIFHGNSGWYIIGTKESFNGQRFYTDSGNIAKWFSDGAFGGSNYSNTPIGTVVNVDEPGQRDFPGMFSSWQTGELFIFSAQADNLHPTDLMIGDPFVRR